MNGFMFDTPAGINAYRLFAIKARMKFEVKTGMTYSRRSTFAMVKKEFGLTGNRQKMYEQFCKICEENGVSETLKKEVKHV